MSVPGYLDRYPAKMVARLSDTLVTRYAAAAESVLDPFCGSGAILQAAAKRRISAAGIDINPYAILLSTVKLHSFDAASAAMVWNKVRKSAQRRSNSLPVAWNGKSYWFTPATLEKYERLRYEFHHAELAASREGAAILLAFALSVRRCSRADQRSPKPFISAQARATRAGKHFDPFTEIDSLLAQLSALYANRSNSDVKLLLHDARMPAQQQAFRRRFTHAVTSPPYINAQDYFRNFKLELYLLETVLPFKVNDFLYHFIGTERGLNFGTLSETRRTRNYNLLPCLKQIERSHAFQARIVHRYMCDMHSALGAIRQMLTPKGTLVLVCGDNLVAGCRVPTWAILSKLAEMHNFERFDRFGDDIQRRYLPPERVGHKGLIKRELISAFRLRQ